ncbi:hypothetical protein SALBM217S_03990 [Streptomyces griseoloalbus]
MLAHHLAALVDERLPPGRVGEVAGDEVLPDQQAEPVRVVEPARRLHLDVLADRVEAELLVRLQVERQGVVAGRGVEPVGPEALVQGGEGEHGLAVEDELLVAAHVLDADLPHAEVAVDRVGGPAVLQRDVEVVQVRVVRAPQVLAGDRQLQLLVGRAGDLADDLAAVVAGDGLDTRRGGRAGRLDGHREGPGVDVGGRDDVVDGRLGDGLHPHGLPDAGGLGVEDAAGVGGLLAHGLVGAAGVGDGDDDLLLAPALEGVGDVGGEGVVAAGVFGDLRAVDVDGGLVVDGAEVELEPVLAALADLPALRHVHELAVEHVVLVPFEPGELRLDRERHDDLPFRSLPKTGCSPASAPLNCQGPLRFFHCERTGGGRGLQRGVGVQLVDGAVMRWVEALSAVRGCGATVLRPPGPPAVEEDGARRCLWRFGRVRRSRSMGTVLTVGRGRCVRPASPSTRRSSRPSGRGGARPRGRGWWGRCSSTSVGGAEGEADAGGRADVGHGELPVGVLERARGQSVRRSAGRGCSGRGRRVRGRG